ncbi:hypothetical protein G7Y89_g6918 [Cudoniella acicularis]|uniref:Uncharacterized protein n=1 Tax=Cudoniella acicularis TaxID=354080 RepID=A0A8H4RKC1_9HELO|nr:hypothetical protein G7Y89_g6918 [Cudoniella acicularis]
MSRTVKKGIPVKWQEVYDTVYPYGDSRQCYFETVWTFDLDKDMLQFSKADRSGRLPLDIVRERPVTFSDFEPCEPPSPPLFNLTEYFPGPFWEPEIEAPARNKVFIRRLLNDFNYQWRHILRGTYNELTFRKLAYAIVQIASLNFRVIECTTSRPGIFGAVIGALDLPPWDALQEQIVPASHGWVVVTQNLADGVSLIEEHLKSQEEQASERSSPQPKITGDYLILSIRHIILYCAHENKLEWTMPEKFLDGASSGCSDRALELLISITYSNPPRNTIHSLPIELQDRVLRYVSQGSVEGARMGCALGIGSPFSWTDGRMEIGSERSHRAWVPFRPIESEIYFGDYRSGLAYRGREGTSKPPYTAAKVAPNVTLNT